ncbi:TonB-dependent receptor [Flammeovirgaceae bacterium SG7u.111]|nr:TonB-dependent receptor [Flammeovirgaceae bacterium SG7u.132]WPO34510.1 TonB-dependent receptor [Flammeovirgaceae bacterium SG7u.111]
MNEVKKIFLLSVLLCFSFSSFSQSVQTIRGQITDKDAKSPIIGATVTVVGSDPLIGAATDPNGYFTLKNVPIGRQELKISAIGYEEMIVPNILVLSGKEAQVNLQLVESITELSEVVVTANDGGIDDLNNDLAVVSARSFDMEQTARFAGARNDPARMATNFAGVSGANDARNDIIIRGNSPNGVLWRLEGIDIPSPNHFSSFGSTGGPVSMLNYNSLAKSDFMTAAFPSEYGNALAGVFDLRMKNGNNGKREFLGQIGFNGFEFGAEGPFSSKSKASYSVNYRYSTLGVFKALGINFGTGSAVPQYQDLNFKINLPTKNAGTFTVFGLGGDSNIELLGSEVDVASEKEDDLYGDENIDIYNKTKTGVFGVSHTYFFTPNTSYKLSVAATHQKESVEIDSVSVEDRSQIIHNTSINNRQNKYSAHLMFSHKFNAKDNLLVGSIVDIYDIKFVDSTLTETGWIPIKQGEGFSTLVRSYVTWQHKFSQNIVLNTGLHHQYFDLSGSQALEPRLGLRINLNSKQSLNAGYGLHHQVQPLPTYYTLSELADGSFVSSNKDMDFTQSHHFVLGYNYQLFPDFRIKAEAYYQKLQNAPVESFPSSFSMLNAGDNFGTPDKGFLVNEGKGTNYGLELTLEKVFSKQYYFLATTSLFNSKYEGSDGIERNTAFNGNYVVNVLGGKEWNLGSKNKVLAVDLKLTSAGGRYYTPIDLEKSIETGQEERLEELAYSERYSDYFRTDLKITYRVNKKKTTQEFAIDIQNVTNRKNEYRHTFNARSNSIVTQYQMGLFPIPQFRILF